MKRHILVVIISLLLTLAPTTMFAADDEYDLRGPGPVKGQIIHVVSKTNYKNATRTLRAGDNVIDDRFNDITTKEKETEVLAVENGQASRVRIKIIKDSTEEIRSKGKRTVKNTRPNRLDGQVLFGERLKDDWKYALDDVTPTPEQKKSLAEYQPFRGDDELLPTKKVKIGDTWKFGTPEFQKILGKQFKELNAKGTGKLLRVEKDGDEPIAFLEIEFEVNGKEIDDGLTLDVKITAKHLIQRSLKTGYDIKGTGTGKLSAKGKGEIEGQKAEVEYSADIVDEEITKVRTSR